VLITSQGKVLKPYSNVSDSIKQCVGHRAVTTDKAPMKQTQHIFCLLNALLLVRQQCQYQDELLAGEVPMLCTEIREA
jgi:hypothetical protein